jgi:DUF1365 family protein
VRSALYEGWLSHRRHETTEHSFRYRLALPLIDLDELDEVCRLHPLWSSGGPNVAWMRPADFFGASPALIRAPGSRRRTVAGRGPSPTSAAAWAEGVRDLVTERLGSRPAGSVSVLASPRTWGWLANPLVAYYCRDADDELAAVVLEVTNTPWHERHHYVVDGAGQHDLAKAMHVSPFLGMDHEYRFRVNDPGEVLSLRLDNHHDGELAFEAALSLRRRPMTRAALGRTIWRHPLQPQRVSAGIYAHALALAVKGASFHRHPA